VKAAVLHALGERPRYEDVGDVVVGDGDVRVAVTACPLTNFDRAQAAGTHYSSAHVSLPAVCGGIAAGVLDDGRHVLFGSAGGTMAEFAVTKPAWCSPIRAGIDDAVAAAVHNPGLSAVVALAWRAKLQPGETVLVMGGTGVTGQVAIQFAKQLGAGRVVASGRDPERLASLLPLGADAVIQLDRSDTEVRDDLRDQAGESGYDVVLDYLWGHPTELLLDALGGGHDMALRFKRTRLLQVGVMAGATVTLPAEVLRSTGLEVMGSGSGTAPPADLIVSELDHLMTMVADGRLRMEMNRFPLPEVEDVWDRDQEGRRTVLIP
jgi:NADPH:quinone reductase-like Zn-dependent oxidoreductase